MKHMTPKGHCFFCNSLTEHAVGKIPICEYCADKLGHLIDKSHNILWSHDELISEEQ